MEMRDTVNALLSHIVNGFQELGDGLKAAIATEAHDNATFAATLSKELNNFERCAVRTQSSLERNWELTDGLFSSSVHQQLLSEATSLQGIVQTNHQNEQVRNPYSVPPFAAHAPPPLSQPTTHFPTSQFPNTSTPQQSPPTSHRQVHD